MARPKVLDVHGKFDPTVDVKTIIGTTATRSDIESAITFRERQIKSTSRASPIYVEEIAKLKEVISTTGTSSASLEFTAQEQRILIAMEAQKKAEKDQARANSEWQKQQDRLQAEIQRMEAERQKTQDFKNRTKEEILQNFIKVQTTKELAGQFDNPEVPTNLNQYLAERGYDVTRPETIPTDIFKPTRLDTAEPKTTKVSYYPNPSFDKGINWNGIRETPSFQSEYISTVKPSSLTISTLFTPPNATNINEPIGRSTPLPPNQITTTGINQPRPPTNLSREVESTADKSSWDKISNISDFSSLALIGASLIKIV